jgi:hypothetical protein
MGKQKLSNILFSLGIIIVIGSFLFFWFKENWFIPELSCWLLGIFLVIYSSYIDL